MNVQPSQSRLNSLNCRRDRTAEHCCSAVSIAAVLIGTDREGVSAALPQLASSVLRWYQPDGFNLRRRRSNDERPYNSGGWLGHGTGQSEKRDTGLTATIPSASSTSALINPAAINSPATPNEIHGRLAASPCLEAG